LCDRVRALEHLALACAEQSVQHHPADLTTWFVTRPELGALRSS
jgi:hypothetical protein